MADWKKHDTYKPNAEWNGHTFYKVIGNKWVKHDAVVPVAEAMPYPDDCLTFSSAEPFTIAVKNETKNWDGTLYYSTDTTTWSEWDGTTAIESATHGADQRIYMRGSGNSVISGGTYQERERGWVLSGNNIGCYGNIENLLDYEMVAKGEHPLMGEFCYSWLFAFCSSLVTAPQLPATQTKPFCYRNMFHWCTSLAVLPVLPATELSIYAYVSMFRGCTSIKLSETQTGEYQTPYRIPTRGNGTIPEVFGDTPIESMFEGTGGSFTGTPSINTTYYTANEVV